MYYIAFAISVLFCGISYISKNKVLFFVFAFLSVITISLIAGVRDETIGTDIQIYGNNVFNLSQNYSNFFDFYTKTSGVFKLEPFYMLLNYFVSRFSVNNAMFYFVLSLVTNTFFFLSINNLKALLSPTLAWFSYLFIFYGYTLNIMRQSLAIAFILFGFSLIINKKNRLGTIFIIFSFFSHFSSGLMGFFILILYFLFIKFKNPIKFLYIIGLIGVVIYLGISPISRILITLGILADRYAVYLNSLSGTGFSILSIFLKLPVFLLFFWRIKGEGKNDRLSLFFFSMLILDFIFYQLRTSAIVFSRISFYFYVFQVISVPYFIKRIPISFDRKFIIFIYSVYIFVVWYYQVVVSGINEIYPYTSEILRLFFE